MWSKGHVKWDLLGLYESAVNKKNDFFENKATISGILSQSREFRGQLSIKILGFGKIATSKEKENDVCL